MADDKHYVGGDWYIIDDITGFKRRASASRLQWDNRFTGPSSFSPRQSQDLVVGVRDDQSVPLPRPRQTNQFVLVGSEVTELAARGATSITVADVSGFAVGHLIQVMLDSGSPFQFTLGAITGLALSWSGAGLPATVGSPLYGSPIENQVIDLTSTGGT